MLAWSVAAPCELRRDIGETALLALAARPGPAGAEASPLVAARARAASLCVSCRANVRGRPLGCAGLLPTPIPGAAERWLLARLPRSMESTAGAILASAVDDFEWDGRYAARLRAAPGQTFAMRTALAQDGGARGALALTSDQAFDMLLGVAHVRRAHPLLLALAFGVIPHDTPPDALGALRQDPAGLWPLLTAARLPRAPTDAVLGPLGDLLRAVGIAAALGVELLVESS